VKAEKYEFHVPMVSFLGYILVQGSLQMDPAKISVVTSRPVPNSRKQLQRFLGFGNFYRQFIRGYSTVAALLQVVLQLFLTLTVSSLWRWMHPTWG